MNRLITPLTAFMLLAIANVSQAQLFSFQAKPNTTQSTATNNNNSSIMSPDDFKNNVQLQFQKNTDDLNTQSQNLLKSLQKDDDNPLSPGGDKNKQQPAKPAQPQAETPPPEQTQPSQPYTGFQTQPPSNENNSPSNPSGGSNNQGGGWNIQY